MGKRRNNANITYPILKLPKISVEIPKDERNKKYISYNASFQRIFRIGSISIRIFGGLIFFILFEITFFSLLNIIGVEFYEIWILELSTVSGFAVFAFGTFSMKKSKIIKCFRILASFLMLIFFIGLFLIVILFFESLYTLIVILGILVSYNILNFIYSIKSRGVLENKNKIKSIILTGLIIFATLGPTLISFLPHSIEIHPKTNPEIIFLCGSNELPYDQNILDMCKKYNISFMPTIKEKDVGNPLYMLAYKKIVANGINLYFLIGGNSNFYAYIDNAKEFPQIYKNVRGWFVSEGIMDNPHVISFSVDAETPSETLEYMKEEGVSNALEFGYNNYPTQEEITNATDALLEFTDMIKKDGKKSGIVHAPRYLDPVDNDGDISLFMRNIYSLEINWDFSIAMMYRIIRFREDVSVIDLPEYIEMSFKLFYGAEIEGTTVTVSELSFYQNVGLEHNLGYTNSDEHYVFVGDFAREFKDTKYIKKREFLTDFDICRHFNDVKVFFYDLQGFIYHYGWDGVEELGQYAQQKTCWYLNYNYYESIAFVMCYCGLIFIDIFAFLERDMI